MRRYKLILDCSIKYSIQLIFLLSLSLAAGGLSLVVPFISGSFVDYLVNREKTEMLFDYMLYYAFSSIGLIVLNFICSRLSNKLCLKITEDICSTSIQCLCESTFSAEKQNHTYLTQRIYSDSVTVTNFFLNLLQNGIINILILLTLVIFLCKYKASFFIIAVLFSGLYIVLYIVFKKKLYGHVKSYKEMQNSYFASFQETISSIKFIRLHSVFNYFRSKSGKKFLNYFDSAQQYQFLSYMLTSLDGVISTFAQICIFFLGGYYVINSEISIGDLTIITSYFGYILTQIRFFFNIAKTYQDFSVSYDRLYEIHVQDKYPDGDKTIAEINKISVNDLTFGFEQLLLKKISADFEKNKIYVIKGKNGSGKTTFANILMGMYQKKYTGTVTINGINIGKLNMNSIRYGDMIYVEQHPFLVRDTIRANLALYSSSSINYPLMNYYLNIFGLDRVISTLPSGLDTEISETKDNFSGGEIQKMCLIRALISNASVLIFDEPTSAFDIESRNVFRKIINEAKCGRIIVIITHDESLISEADELLSI